MAANQQWSSSGLTTISSGTISSGVYFPTSPKEQQMAQEYIIGTGEDKTFVFPYPGRQDATTSVPAVTVYDRVVEELSEEDSVTLSQAAVDVTLVDEQIVVKFTEAPARRGALVVIKY